MIKCECGGEYRLVILRDFDFSPYAGLPALIPRSAQAPGLRCNKCKTETIQGPMIEILLASLAASVIAVPHRLDPAQARFLRKRLSLTQKELADRMGLDRRETVTEWETGAKPLSPQSDYILRTLVYRDLVRDWPMVEELTRGVMDRVQTRAQEDSPPPFIIDKVLRTFRDDGSHRSGGN